MIIVIIIIVVIVISMIIMIMIMLMIIVIIINFITISYPYGGTVNFQTQYHRDHRHYSHHLDHHDHDHAHDHRDHHQFHEMSYPYGGTVNFQICPKIALVKVTDLVPLRALFGPGAPDADLSIFKLGFSHKLIMRNTARWIHRRATLDT